MNKKIHNMPTKTENMKPRFNREEFQKILNEESNNWRKTMYKLKDMIIDAETDKIDGKISINDKLKQYEIDKLKEDELNARYKNGNIIIKVGVSVLKSKKWVEKKAVNITTAGTGLTTSAVGVSSVAGESLNVPEVAAIGLIVAGLAVTISSFSDRAKNFIDKYLDSDSIVSKKMQLIRIYISNLRIMLNY